MAAILRFYQLGQNPPSLDWDETAHGYNAYSILKTGRDEYGYKFPLYFRSFDDYKPPLYTYLVVPAVAVFGLNDFAVRFPSALLGTLAVLFTYLMVKELFTFTARGPVSSFLPASARSDLKSDGCKKDHADLRAVGNPSRTATPRDQFSILNSQFSIVIALLSALFLAISPWHLQFSRVAFETNSAIFWSVLGTWAFLKGIRTKGWSITVWMSLAAIAFGANLFMYHNARVFIPIFSIILLFIFKKELFNYKKYLVVPAVIAIIFSAALIPIIFSISGQLRFKGTTIFADVSPQYKNAQLIAQDEKLGQLTLGRIFHNRRFVYIPILIDNYLSHLKPTYLFLTADMDRHHAPQIGLLYLWDLPFILAGIYFLIKKKFDTKSKVIVFCWFLLAPVASAVTWGVPHALRSEIYLPTYQIFAAVGLYCLYQSIKWKKIFITFAFCLLAFNFLFYLHQYYVHMPVEYSKAWLYGRKEAALFAESVKDKYDRVIVSTKLEQPHEFWLYYTKYDPQKYLAQGGTVSGGYLEDKNKFDKYFFKAIDFNEQQKEAKTLFVGLPNEFPATANLLAKINYLNDEPAIYIVGGN